VTTEPCFHQNAFIANIISGEKIQNAEIGIPSYTKSVTTSRVRFRSSRHFIHPVSYVANNFLNTFGVVYNNK
jgi:hypothetical protein